MFKKIIKKILGKLNLLKFVEWNLKPNYKELFQNTYYIFEYEIDKKLKLQSKNYAKIL